MSIRIVLADHQTLVRYCLRVVLQQEGDMEIVGEVDDGYCAVEIARRLLPDVVVMDVNTPDMNDIEAVRKICTEAPTPKVLVLSMCSASRCITAMFDAGASAYLLKNCECDELVHAVRRVAEGFSYVGRSIHTVIMEKSLSGPEKIRSTTFSVLTPREKEILQLLGDGYDTGQIARHLAIEPNTVKSHRQRLTGKLNIKSNAQLVKYAVLEGLTSLDAPTDVSLRRPDDYCE